MSNVKITVGGAMEEEGSQRFVDAWYRAERGETFHERRLRSRAGTLSPAS